MLMKFEDRPAVAEWKLKGAGVAYTTSRKILESQAGQRMLAAAKRIYFQSIKNAQTGTNSGNTP